MYSYVYCEVSLDGEILEIVRCLIIEVLMNKLCIIFVVIINKVLKE